MSRDDLLLCTDLDRTLVPNGAQPEHPQARPAFCGFCSQPMVRLAYVSGRDLGRVEQAIARYQLPWPDYAITDVGTKIYQRDDVSWHEVARWQQHIAQSWRGHSHEQLKQTLSVVAELQLQEASKQNDFKLSYYVPLTADHHNVLSSVQHHLERLGVEVELIWSIDDIEQVGLLDVLPRNACKRKAIEFLQRELGYASDQVVFAGDSGNDLAVLVSPIRSILVANADLDIKRQARQQAAEQGNSERLYIACDNVSALGGNYAAGILQGIAFFFPRLMAAINGKATVKG